MDSNTVWFVILWGLLAGYLVLDGFDLGIGILYIFSPREYRKTMLGMIGPYWDGNEVWLIIFGAVIFAVFPRLYGALLSGLYLPFMLLLFAFIFRGLAINLRDHYNSRPVQDFIDFCFGLSSVLVVICLSIVFANMLIGMPLEENFTLRAGFRNLVNLTSVVSAVVGVILLGLHGLAFGCLKSPDNMLPYFRKKLFIFWSLTLVILMLFCSYVVLNLFRTRPPAHPAFFWFLISVSIAAVIFGLRAFRSGCHFQVFIASAFLIITTVALFASALYPKLMVSSIDEDFGIDIYNAAAAPRTLKVMLVIIGIGMPIVIAYTICIYTVLRTKTRRLIA